MTQIILERAYKATTLFDNSLTIIPIFRFVYSNLVLGSVESVHKKREIKGNAQSDILTSKYIRILHSK